MKHIMSHYFKKEALIIAKQIDQKQAAIDEVRRDILDLVEDYKQEGLWLSDSNPPGIRTLEWQIKILRNQIKELNNRQTEIKTIQKYLV